MTASRQYLFGAGLVLTASALAWVVAPTPAPVAPPNAAVESWEPPKAQHYDPVKWLSILRGHSLWGGSAEFEVAPGGAAGGGRGRAAAAVAWSIVGVVIEGADAFVLISIGDEVSKPYKIGDSLPDGGKISRIEEDRLYYWANGSESVLEIYRK